MQPLRAARASASSYQILFVRVPLEIGGDEAAFDDDLLASVGHPRVRTDKLRSNLLPSNMVALRRRRQHAGQGGPRQLPDNTAAVGNLGHRVGLSAVNAEQQGLLTGWNSISSIRVPSGS